MRLGLVLLSVMVSAGSVVTGEQSPTAATATSVAAQTMLQMIASVEKQITGIATEMPADKYKFAPTQGAFRGVRDFAEQIKHAAAVHYWVGVTILGEPVTSDMADERGPDSVQTKEAVLKYLADSFVVLKRAAATVTDQNAFAVLKSPFGAGTDSRVGLIGVAVNHTSNHYGQVVEYLRMNGLTPPR